MQKNTDWGGFKHILCIRPDNLGDVLMTSPAIRALKESVPDRKITLLTSKAGKAIARYIPEIDEVIAFDIPWYKHEQRNSGPEVLEIIERIKTEKFDAAIIFTVFSQNPLPTAMLCFMAGIPRMAGYCRENPYSLITDWLPDREPLYEIKHEVTRQLDLARHLGAKVKVEELTLTIKKEAKALVLEKLQKSGINMDKPWIIIHPGVSETKRQYPIALFAEVVKSLVVETGYQVLLTGVQPEIALANYIISEVGREVYSLIGKLEMEELIALIAQAPLLIANNTGPVHIAAAVNTPVVVLYAMTNPQHTPWKVPNKVLAFSVPKAIRSKNVIIEKANEQSFEENKAMVQPREVIEAAKELLGLSSSSTVNLAMEENKLKRQRSLKTKLSV